MQECLIRLKQGVTIGYVLSRNGNSAKIRVTGKPVGHINENTDLLKIADEGAQERTHQTGKIIDVDDFVMAFPIRK